MSTTTKQTQKKVMAPAKNAKKTGSAVAAPIVATPIVAAVEAPVAVVEVAPVAVVEVAPVAVVEVVPVAVDMVVDEAEAPVDAAAEEDEAAGLAEAEAAEPAIAETVILSFKDCLEKLAKNMEESYTLDENGAPIELGEDQMAGIQQTIESVKESASQVFEPFFAPFLAQAEAQKTQIDTLTARVESLRARLAGTSGTPGTSATTAAAVVPFDENAEIPTAAWIIANRKSKSGKDISGYNCFTMWFMAKNKNGFPPKGVWDQQNKAAWNTLSKQVNSLVTSADAISGAVPGGVAAVAAPIELPTTKGKGQKLTAYNMYTIDYMAKNPNKGFPPKGSWALVPKNEVARYQAQADALKAQRA